jgi:hypothetical protein
VPFIPRPRGFDPRCPSAAHHRHEADFVRALLRRAYDVASAELRAAISARQYVGEVFHGGLDAGHATFIAHLEGELAAFEALKKAGAPRSYKISSGIFNSVKASMYVPACIR